jgi:hypothetical protein
VVQRYLMTRTWMSVVSLIVAIVAAALDYFPTSPGLGILDCDWEDVLQGANINLACRIVVLTGAAVLVTMLVTRHGLPQDRFRRALAVLLFLEAGALAVAVGFILADSATWVAELTYYDCPAGRSPVVGHVYGLLAVCGVTLAFVLLRAFGAWTGVERADRAHRPEPHLAS